MADEAPTNSEDAQITFKVKTGSDGNHQITMAETATVLDLKTKLATTDYENIPAERQRLIYSGRVMKNEEPLSTYKIKAGNTIHMVKSAASNPAPQTTAAVPSGGGAAAGVPTNMAAGTANNPLAGLTGARYAGHIGLPNASMFGVDGGMGAPPSEDQMAEMLSDPATAQMMNEALNNPQMIEMMIQSNPTLRAMGPQAREVLQSPLFRQMMTNPAMLRQAAAMRRAMGESDPASGGFPAPGATDTTPEGAARSSNTPAASMNAPAPNTFPADLFANFPAPAVVGTANANNPFASLFGPLPATGAPAAAGDATAMPPNPFASMFGAPGGVGAAGGAGSPLPSMTPEMMRQAMQMFGGGSELGGFGMPPAAAAPVDSRPPEEQYADQLRQLNDMGFFDFDRNVQALRRSGGSVEGAIEQLLS